MPSSDRRVIVAMLGARMHYAVPRILYQLGCLEHFYTDTYIGNKPVLERILRALPRWVQNEDVSRLNGRRHNAIPGELVTSFDALGVRYAIARRRARDDASRAATFETFNHRFNRAVVRQGFGAADTVWGFNTASAGMFQAAKARGLTCILEQTILPSALEHRLLSEVAEECRSWHPDFRDGDGGLQHLEQAEWELADIVVAGSPFVADGLEACGVAPDRIRVVPYGVDSKVFSPRPKMPRQGARPLRLLFVGEVGLRKGVPYLLQALDLLPKGMVELKLAGSVVLAQESIARYNDVAQFLGPLPRGEMPSLFQWADALVLPSIVEGSATVTYEALLSGIPVITTPNSGSIVEHGVSGQIVPIRNPRAIADAIEAYADEHDLLERHRASVVRVRPKADIARYARDLSALFGNPAS
jgi:hypothetical protein